MPSKQIAPFWIAALRAARGHHLARTLTGIVICIDAVWMLLAEWSVSGRGVLMIALVAVVFLAPLTLERYRRDIRLDTTLRAAALLIVFQAAGATLSYLVISTDAPLVDASLSAWDRSMGFDWIASYAWIQEHPFARMALRHAYQSGLLQLVFVILFLGFSTHTARLDEFMRLFVVITLLTIVVSAPLPAAGAWKYYAQTRDVNLSALSHFELLRDGRMRDIPLLGQMQGLISIPSLHAAAAVLFVYAMRGTRLLPAFAVLNLLMLLSTPFDGSHYLVDVLAGAAMALMSIGIERGRGVDRHVADSTSTKQRVPQPT